MVYKNVLYYITYITTMLLLYLVPSVKRLTDTTVRPERCNDQEVFNCGKLIDYSIYAARFRSDDFFGSYRLFFFVVWR